MKLSAKVLLICFICLATKLLAQPGNDARINNDLEKRIETIAENSDEEIDFTVLFDNLSYYQEHPIELNKASFNDLQQLLILSDFQINNLLRHINQYGPLLSVFELQAVEGFDLNTIYSVLPYIKVDRDLNRINISLKTILKNAKHEFFWRTSAVIEEQRGFAPISPEELEANPNARFLGDPFRHFTRYRYRYGNIFSMGFTAEKDAGEEFFRGTQPQGFDFYSGHIYVGNIGKLKSAVVGDYQAQFGQGITFWSGFAFGKTADAMNVKRTGQGLRPYTSVNENLFLRGAATTWTLFKHFELTAFASRRALNTNATAVDSVSQDIVAFSSFNISGLHRTFNELSKKNNVREDILGGHVTFRKRIVNIGLTAVKSVYSAALVRRNAPYNNFEFQGSENFNLGLDYNAIWRNFNIFGEVARSANGGMATNMGFIAALDPKFSLSFYHRNFARNYQAVYTAAIAEGSRNINEVGTYLGAVYKPHRAWNIAAYFDRFHFPWLRYLVDAPSNGFDGLIQVNYTPSRTFDMYFRYRTRENPRNIPNFDEYIDYPTGRFQQNVRFDVSYKVSPAIKLRNRFEYCFYRQDMAEKERGFILLQDVFYRKLNSPWVMSMRYMIFDTDGFNSRIYTYENDVLYSFSIPSFSNKGFRTYLNLEYNFNSRIDVWFRIAQTYWTNRNSSGSGLTTVEGPSRTDYRVQIRFKF